MFEELFKDVSITLFFLEFFNYLKKSWFSIISKHLYLLDVKLNSLEMTLFAELSNQKSINEVIHSYSTVKDMNNNYK
jgi:hypothetical protein